MSDRFRKWVWLLLASATLTSSAPAQGPASADGGDVDVDALIRWLIDHDEELAEIPFPKVINATSGRKIIPIDRTDAETESYLARLEEGIEIALKRLLDSSHPVHKSKRINEASAHFERELLAALNEVDGFRCEYPKTAAGKTQRSGYPDLQLVDSKTGRVAYIDPKLFAKDSRNSSLRTFYFTPKRSTNKVLVDAHHILIGFPHDGRGAEGWKFIGWEMVDLSRFSVRLKSEFQGSNRDLYTDTAVIRRSNGN